MLQSQKLVENTFLTAYPTGFDSYQITFHLKTYNSQFKVYEEEVLGPMVPLWWSPEGTKIAFASFDDTRVDQIMLTR